MQSSAIQSWLGFSLVTWSETKGNQTFGGGQADQPWSKGVKDIDGFGVLVGEELQPSTKRLQHVDLMLNMGYDNLSRIPHFVGK